MIKIGINGLGRIGRAIFRIVSNFNDVEVTAINDINPEIENMVYLLRYDSFYGRFGKTIFVKNGNIIFNRKAIPVFHEEVISDVDWAKYCDVVIEAAGVHSNLKHMPKIIESGVKKIIVTYSPDEVINHTIVLGANEQTYEPAKHHIISSSICDTVAFAPVYRLVDEKFGIESGFLTTLHPWLSYQNLLDGPSVSWGIPGTLYQHYAIGRASTASIIPKPTSAIEATEKVLPGVLEKMKCYSFRVPTPVVGAADITFKLKSEATPEKLIKTFKKFERNQKWSIIKINSEQLVSVDITGTDYSAVIDTRWIEVAKGDLVNITLWYDNEWGYSRRVVDLIRHLFKLKPRHIISEKNSLS